MKTTKWYVLSILLFSFVMRVCMAGESRDEIIVPPEYDPFYSKWHFSPATRSGEFIFASGVIGFDKDLKQVIADPEQQYRAAFEILADILAASGATLDDTVDLTTFHTPGSNRALFAKVKNEYMKGPAYPAWTAVTVSELSFDALVEIKAIAVRNWSPEINRREKDKQ